MNQPDNQLSPVGCADLLSVVRADLADTLEEIGRAMGLLREGIADMKYGNEGGAQMCAVDACGIICALESAMSHLGAKLAMWTHSPDWPGEDDPSPDNDLGMATAISRPVHSSHRAPSPSPPCSRA